jgi:nicotinamidase-related amidase
MAKQISKNEKLALTLRSQELRQYSDKARRGWNYWHVLEKPVKVKASELLILVCDMWDDHTSAAAGARVAAMAPKMNAVVKAARSKGAHIIHAPSDCMDVYADTPARQRMIDAPRTQPPSLAKHDDPALPVDTSKGGSDSCTIDRKFTGLPWTRQHKAIEIDQSRDGISSSGVELYNYMQQQGIKLYAIMGVHTGMCILHRTFGIKQMVRWQVPTVLVRDMTDAMYDPASSPYVSHDEGTRLVVEFIEKFWCPTITSDQLL